MISIPYPSIPPPTQHASSADDTPREPWISGFLNFLNSPCTTPHPGGPSVRTGLPNLPGSIPSDTPQPRVVHARPRAAFSLRTQDLSEKLRVDTTNTTDPPRPLRQLLIVRYPPSVLCARARYLNFHGLCGEARSPAEQWTDFAK